MEQSDLASSLSDEEDQDSGPENTPGDVVTPENGNGTNTSDVPKGRRSDMYRHFTWELKQDRWKCNYCGKLYQQPKQGGTGSLHNHMKSKHPRQLIKRENPLSSHLTITKREKLEIPSVTAEEFKQHLIEFTITCDLPFTTVDNESFNSFVQYVSRKNPICELPSRQTFRTWISDLYAQEKAKIKALLEENASKISITTDCWTSSNMHSFQGVTASWINDSFSLQTVVLDLTPLTGSHSGENLANHLSAVLEDFGIWKKLLAITTDNASNMNTMFRHLSTMAAEKGYEFKMEDTRVRCIAHIINLSCKSMVKSLDLTVDESEDPDDYDESDRPPNVISKLRRGIVKIRSSNLRLEVFRRQCEANNLTKRNPARDVPTRWNSTLNMIETAVELRQPLTNTLTSFRELRPYFLSDDDWIVLEQLIKLLKPFRDATRLLSSCGPVFANTVAVYEALFAHLESYINADLTTTNYRARGRRQSSIFHPSWIVKAAECGWNKLKEYYPTCDGLVYSVATILDPRFKDKWYAAVQWKKEWISSCKAAVKQLWNTYDQGTASNTDDSSRNETLVNPILGLISDQMKSVHRGSSSDELSKYLRESTVMQELIDESGGGILGWWKLHQHEYPSLSKMARDFLAVSGTGVPCERFFSSATDLLSHRRQRLAPETINECLCLKQWLKRNRTPLSDDLKQNVLFKIIGDAECDI